MAMLSKHRIAYYNHFTKEWVGKCASCGDPLYAPNKKDFIRTRLNHTRNHCGGKLKGLGGW